MVFLHSTVVPPFIYSLLMFSDISIYLFLSISPSLLVLFPHCQSYLKTSSLPWATDSWLFTLSLMFAMAFCSQTKMQLRKGCMFCNSRGISTPPDLISGGCVLLLLTLILLSLLQGYLTNPWPTRELMVGQLNITDVSPCYLFPCRKWLQCYATGRLYFMIITKQMVLVHLSVPTNGLVWKLY
jgi:hypothetical protein